MAKGGGKGRVKRYKDRKDFAHLQTFYTLFCNKNALQISTIK